MVKQLIEKKLNGNVSVVWWIMGLLAAVILYSVTTFTSWASCGIGVAYKLEEEFPKVCDRVTKIETRNQRKDSDWITLEQKIDRQNAILLGIAKATGATIPAGDLLE